MNTKLISVALVLLLGQVSENAIASSISIDGTSYSKRVLTLLGGQQDIEACDVNADGNVDLIVANNKGNNITVFLGNGSGSLTKLGSFAAGDNPIDLDSADINGDGHVDVAIANHDTSYVTLMLGDGTGNFKAMAPLHIGANPHAHAVRLEDLNADSKVDLLIDSRDNESILVLEGDGKGKFSKPQQIHVGGAPYRGFAVGDLNADGSLDIVTPNQREIGIVLSTNTEKFEFDIDILALSEKPFSVEMGDLTGDGIEDLVVATNGASVSVYAGEESGYLSPNPISEIETATGAKQIAIGDINNDGISDALVSSWDGQALVILGGRNGLERHILSYEHRYSPWAVALADLNNDGKDDMIVADGVNNEAFVYVSNKQESK